MMTTRTVPIVDTDRLCQVLARCTAESRRQTPSYALTFGVIADALWPDDKGLGSTTPEGRALDRALQRARKIGLVTYRGMLGGWSLTAAGLDRARMRLKRRSNGVFLSSKCAHAPRWIALRDTGYPVHASWIDTITPHTVRSERAQSLKDLWQRCVREAIEASAIVVYVEKDEPMKGSLLEIGAALGAGVPVIVKGWEHLETHTWLYHPKVRLAGSLEEALETAKAIHEGRDA